ncbi:sulfite exporter TauE/SafE family protein [Temperatibacter marinus]|uniref:Probable membrane transporter protein n=1 Tax=Temperatibacter marinus TaxID=1456591 RepID=A0AA52EAB7_9PROT|nr:sulfite exporter TauE/SafE family protein [Temperatibacter marinus]WND01622.1 sulfite exporter TauE/SafE family protein [Temperatibacter marinus]
MSTLDLFLISLSFISSFITVVFGIGGGTIMLLAMVAILPPAQIIMIHGLVQLSSNFFRAVMFRKTVVWSKVNVFMLASFLGVGIGTLLTVELPVVAIKLSIAVFILFTLFVKIPAMTTKGWLVGGVVSSILTMFVGATGTLVAALVNVFEQRKDYLIGTLAAMMVVQHGLKVIGLLLVAHVVEIDWLVVLCICTAGILGTLTGKKVGQRMADDTYKKGLKIALGLSALWIIVDILMGFTT